MGEAKTKPLAWTGVLSTVDRWAVLQAMEFRAIPCQRCGAGKMTFDGDPQKVLRYGRLWDALGLSAIDALSAEDVGRLVGKRVLPSAAELPAPDPALAAPLEVTLENDLVRMLLADVIAPRARFAVRTGVMLFLPVVDQLLAYADDARLKLRDRGDEELSDGDDVRELRLSGAERQAIWDLLLAPSTCSNRFETMDGRTVPCMFPADGPRSVRELEEWVHLLNQLGFEAAFEGGIPDIDPGAAASVELLDIATVRLLSGLLAGRAHMLPQGPRKLGKVLAALEAIKSGGGKPARPQTEGRAEAAE